MNGDWLDIDQLAHQCRLPDPDAYRPHPRQWIGAVPGIVRSKAAAAAGALTLVFLAVDGLSFDVARACWTPRRMVPLTSTFPSTSSVAWFTIATGLGAEDHGIPGVVWRAIDSDRLVFAFDPAGEEIHPCPTMFEALTPLGITSLASIGDLANWPGPWSNALVRGALVAAPTVDWRACRYDPTAIVRWVDREIERGLATLEHTPRRLLWIFVNFDDYVHRHGYDDRLQAALRSLDRSLHGWAGRGCSVGAVADHGMVATRHCDEMASLWRALETPEYCELPAGGAGRVRWWYPRMGRDGELRRRLAETYPQDLFVATYDELVALRVVSHTAANARRMGSVVAVARGNRFPLTISDVNYEHGALSREEMFVPLAWWEEG